MTRASRLRAACAVALSAAAVGPLALPNRADALAYTCTTQADGTRACEGTDGPFTLAPACPAGGGIVTYIFEEYIPADAINPTSTVTADPPPLCPGATITKTEQDNAPPQFGTPPAGERVFRIEVKVESPTGNSGGQTPQVTVKVDFGLPPASGGGTGNGDGNGTAPPRSLEYDLTMGIAQQRTRWGEPFVTTVDRDTPASQRMRIFDYVWFEHPDGSPKQRPSAPTTFNFSSEPALPIDGHTRPHGRSGRFGDCESAPTGTACKVPAIDPRRPDFDSPLAAWLYFDAELDVRTAVAALGKTYRLTLVLGCRSSEGEINCANNTIVRDIEFVQAADSTISKKRRISVLFDGEARGRLPVRRVSRRGIRGAAVAPADRPRGVEVALVRLGRGQRAFVGEPSPVGSPTSPGQTCAWLAGRNGRVRETPLGAERTCDTPLWLRASGSTRWSFRLKKRLGPGRYVLYSRAVTRAGGVEQFFSARDGNRRAFVVRKRH